MTVLARHIVVVSSTALRDQVVTDPIILEQVARPIIVARSTILQVRVLTIPIRGSQPGLWLVDTCKVMIFMYQIKES